MRDPNNAKPHICRHAHTRKFNSDLPAICKDLKERSGDLSVRENILATGDRVP